MSPLPILSLFPFFYAPTANAAVVHGDALSSSCTRIRSLTDILISCAMTLFACTWTAIHPNIPGPVEGSIVVAVRRLGIMILAFVAPEIIVMSAVRQLFAARAVQKQFQDALRDGTLELRVKPYCEPHLVSRNVPLGADEVRVGEVTESWFEYLASLWSSIIAMLPRTIFHVHERLGPPPVSAKAIKSYYHWTLKHSFYAWMGGFVLFIDKDPALPREIYYPITPDELFEFLKDDRIQVSMISETDLDDRSKGDWLSKTIAVMQLIWFVMQLAARAVKPLPTTQLEINTLAISILSCFSYAVWWHKPQDVQYPVPVYWKEPGELPKTKFSACQCIDEFHRQFGFKANWIGDGFRHIFQPLLNLGGVHSVSCTAVKAHRVPYLCGYPPDFETSRQRQSLLISISGVLAGMVFAGIHCIAWNFMFPTRAEQILWRVTSVATVVMLGLALALVKSLFGAAANGEPTPHASIKAGFSLTIVLLYFSCHLILVVLMLLSLRSLPRGVYDEVCWTIPIPHW